MNTKLLSIARWIPAVAIAVTSCTLSSMPTIESMPTFFGADKLVHTVCFGGLAFWIAFGFNGAGRDRWTKWAIPAILTSVYGIADELHQSFTPGRSCSVYDWIADTLGGALVSLAYLWVATLFLKLRGKA